MTTPAHVLAIDQGTTCTTALIFDQAPRIVGRATAEITQHYPQPGWVEHDADEIWRVTQTVVGRALAAAGLAARELAAIGLTNQRETTVLWERATGQPVARAIVWQDRRTAGMCEALRAAGQGDRVRAVTGLTLDPYFSGAKIRWLLDETPGLRARATRGELAFGTIDTWLLWKLTGGKVHATDPSNASRTLLFNLQRGDWDPEMLDLLGVPAQLLPVVGPSSGALGVTDPAVFGGARVPVSGMAGDQQAALFGQACHGRGLAKNTYGTGCFTLLPTGPTPMPSAAGLLTTVAWRLGAQPLEYALEGSVFVAGAAIQWLRDGLGIIREAGESEALAESVASTDDVFFVPALTGLGTPDWDPRARGLIVGLTRGTTRAHIARAALESIAFQTADVIAAMERDAGVKLSALRADGGAAVNGFLMQFQADLLGVPVEVPAVTETTALGAAYLAGLATGVWGSRAEIDAGWSCARRYEPRFGADERAARQARWRAAVARARGWAAQ